VYGALAIGVLDLLDAFIFFGLRGVAPIRILHSIAAGVLGRAAFDGGVGTAVLGVILHFTIATGIMLVFLVISGWWPGLRRRALVAGPLYGIVVWCVMNFIILPVSATTRGSTHWPVLLNGLIIHALGVGLPAALIARRIGSGQQLRGAGASAQPRAY
jgi:hypothetical protein